MRLGSSSSNQRCCAKGRCANHRRSANQNVTPRASSTKRRSTVSSLGNSRQFLTMMSPQIIKAIKQAALEDDRAAWDVMEEAVTQQLERRKSK
ncbi:hypothetical protein CQ14_09225 [Bradyrhizobium lablabi]|uniref:Uncharacterized protein n=1 Tax=Bradyrhizobium lablabi TaxID=722472 RepID=A0A0R3N696_9BRAD|nr:hypothetical protein CQ14_09225 [Bradyrhizobium lablabi]